HHWLNFILQPPDGFDDLRIMLILLAASIVFYFIGWPLLLLLLDFIWLIIALLGALISFVVLRRPITLVARHDDETYSWKVRGLLKASMQKQEIVRLIQSRSTASLAAYSPKLEIK